MWNKLFFGSLAAAMITACGPSVSEATPQERRVEEKPDRVLDHVPGHDVSGGLPLTLPPASVAKVQAQFVAEIYKGVPRQKFSKLKIKPEDTISRGKVKLARDDGAPIEVYRMYLVHSHLKLTESQCSGGQGYEGWIAATTGLVLNVDGPASRVAFVRPYRVSICETDGVLDYEVIELGDVYTPDQE